MPAETAVLSPTERSSWLGPSPSAASAAPATARVCGIALRTVATVSSRRNYRRSGIVDAGAVVTVVEGAVDGGVVVTVCSSPAHPEKMKPATASEASATGSLTAISLGRATSA